MRGEAVPAVWTGSGCAARRSVARISCRAVVIARAGGIARIRQRDIVWIHPWRVPIREHHGEAAVAGAFDHHTHRAATHRAAKHTTQMADSHHTIANVKLG